MLTSLGMWNGGRNLVPLDQLEDDLQLLKCALQIELTMPQVSANILCFVFLWHGGGTWDVCKAPGIGVPPKEHKCCLSEQSLLHGICFISSRLDMVYL